MTSPISHPVAQVRRMLPPLLAIAIALPSFAQVAPVSPTSTSDEEKAPVAPVVATTDKKVQEDTVVLSPFQVTTSQDQGYFAANTLAGSRMNTNISDLAASISVVTKQQMVDTGSLDINDVFRYEANTEGSGSYTPSVQSLRNDGVVDLNAGYTHGGDGQPQTNAIANRVRGIGIPGAAINYYPSIAQVPFDAYNVQSIEISRGPNSMLFGMGSPAGIVNQSTAQAVFGQDTTSVSLRTDNYGSMRGSVAVNQSLIDDKLAIYGAYLNQNQQFARKPSYDKTRRAYGAIAYRPFRKTVFRANIEDYHNDNRRPNSLTPRDAVTPWRLGGMPSYDPTNGTVTFAGTGRVIGPIVMSSGSPNIALTRQNIMAMPGYDASKWNAAQTAYNGVNIYGTGTVTNTASALYAPGLQFPTLSRPIVQVAGGQPVAYFYAQPDRYRQVYGTASNPAANAAQYPASDSAVYADPANVHPYDARWTFSNFLPAPAGIGSYRYPGVTDKSIYDYSSINTLQANHGRDKNTTINLEWEQEILPELNLSAGWFRQDFDSYSAYTISQLNAATLWVDTNLKYQDGSVNPYYGQPFVNDFEPDHFVNRELSDNYRVMLAWTPDFTQNSGWTRWLGRHQVLGLGTRQESTKTFIRERLYVTGGDEAANGTIFFSKNPNANANGSATGYNTENRSTQHLFYLGTPGNQPYGTVNTSSGTFDRNLYDGRMTYYNFDTHGYETLDMVSNYVDHSATTGRTFRQVDSLSFGLTSYLWQDRLVTTFGWRKDDYKARSTTTGAILDEQGNQVAPGMTNQEKWIDGVFQTDTVLNRYNYWDQLTGNTRTAGAVLKPFKDHAGIDQRAADGSLFWQFVQNFGISYNKSDNFNPPTVAQVDGFGNPLPKPTGEGKDYGFQFSLFDNKLFARVNWFKATNQNERTNPGTSISRLTGNVDTTLFRNWARTIALINMGQDPRDTTTFGVGLTPAEEDAVQTAAAAIWQQPYTYYDDIGQIYATRSAEASGMEVNVTYNPTRNWTMKFTAGKQETKYANVLKEFDAWYNVRYPVWQAAKATDYLAPAYQGLAKYTTTGGREVDISNFLSSYGFNSNVGLDNAFGLYNVQLYYDNIVTPQVAIASDLEGQAAPNQRKWRWSYLTNYQFSSGKLKGLAIGGNVRWEDKAVIGYYGRPNTAAGTTDLTLSDVSKPIWDQAKTYVDLSISHTSRLFHDKVRMRVQLNVYNVFENGGLQTVGVNYDGSPYAFRIVDPREFALTTTFDF